MILCSEYNKVAKVIQQQVMYAIGVCNEKIQLTRLLYNPCYLVEDYLKTTYNEIANKSLLQLMTEPQSNCTPS